MSTASGSRWVWWWPAFAALFLTIASLYGVAGTFRGSPLGVVLAIGLLPVLSGAVFAAVHHSEVIAIRTGEPYGTLTLTVAVTVIEVALITSVMAAGGSPTLARDSVFAVIMLVCNGLVGLCIVIGGLYFREQSFRVPGASSYLIVLMTLAVLTLVLPNFTNAAPGPYYSTAQLAFVSLATIALYAAFLYIQTVRHRDHFIIEQDAPTGEVNLEPPSNLQITASASALLVCLTIVVLLAKKFAAVLEVALAAAEAPAGVAGVVVALLVLLPEAIAAVIAARRNHLQKSINLALGCSLATIGLTVPAVAMVIGRGLVLGLGQKETVLLILTFAVSLLTFASGRTNILSGFVHLVLMATFIFLVFVP
jgi:Ca2+:H+ antiporter